MKVKAERQLAAGSRQRAVNRAPSLNRSRDHFIVCFKRRGLNCLLPAACCLLTLALSLLTVSFAAHAQRGAIVDQILALVNGEVITRSDLLWSLALDPDAPSPAGPVSSDVLQRKLDVMIDERLVAQEAARLPAAEVTQEEINRRRAELIASFPSEAAFRERVESVGLTPQRLDELISQRILIDRFVEFRFKSFVLVTDAEIQRYYTEEFAPEIRKRGQVPPSLDEKLEKGTVRDQIREILQQRKIEQEINRWLEAARLRADIVQLAEP
ncbi:MAG TPA: hypothetical protein VNN73_18610 [Blastocatellia bacterium]|nr:hypothetical protein [Blastocatellia bacterium]